jgi:hypothetical protein
MILNRFLIILIAFMIVRDGILLVRHRRPFRLAFVAFWVLLACAHFTRRTELYLVIALTLLAALGMRRRELSEVARVLEEKAPGKPDPAAAKSELWDREFDGNV